MRTVIIFLFFASSVLARTYTTNFSATENPISEGGNWINGGAVGLDWANVRTTSGLAYGTQGGSGAYDDTAAILSGTWGPDQSVQATVYTTNQSSDPVYEEVEFRLRSSISAHSNTGYEITFRCLYGSGYVQIVRWNGALGSFTYITNAATGPYNGIQTGDVLSATITGNLIIGYVNGIEVIRGTDSTYTTGNPGIGFFLQGASTRNPDFGFTSFSATDGIPVSAPFNPCRAVLVRHTNFSNEKHSKTTYRNYVWAFRAKR